MICVASHAAPKPVTSTPRSHACGVNRGSRPTVIENPYAAATEIASCVHSIQPIRMAGA